MFKFVALVALVASANAGVLVGPNVLSASPLTVGNSIAVGPSIGATLLGRTTINAPETTIVKQQVVVDQPEIRLRSVPTVVQAAPQIISAPQVSIARSVVAPQVISAPQVVSQQVISAPQVAVARSVVAPQLISAPQVAVARSVVAPQLISAPQVAVARSVTAPQLISAPQVAVARSVVAPQLISAPQVALTRSIVAPQFAENTVQTIATPFSLQQQLVAGIGSQTLLASPVSSPTLLTLKK